jgi:hypothetical protein
MLIEFFKEVKAETKNTKASVEYFDALRLQPGQQLFMFDMITNQISALSLSTSRLLVKDACFYVPAINEKNARKKFAKMIKAA